MKVTVNELKDGTVARISIAQFAKLSNEHLNTMSRKLRENRFTAITDPVTGRIYIPAESALAYLEGKPYKHNRLNAEDKATKTASRKAGGAA